CSCPGDCGNCSGQYGNDACKELGCVSGVCKIILKTNCCGNATCESSETYEGCPADCTPKSIDISVIVPSVNDYFVFGEKANVVVEILADGKSKVIGAEASFRIGSKNYVLYNDSRHGDSSSFDAIYGNFVNVLPSMLGPNPVEFTAVFRGVTGTAKANFLVKPDLNVVLDIPQSVALGDVLDLQGFVRAKAKPVGIMLDANIFFQGKSVFNSVFASDVNTGAFSFSYPVSLLGKLGEYSLLITGIDGNGNKAFFQRAFEVKEKVFAKKLSIAIEPLQKESFGRGEEVPLVIAISDESGNGVEKAEAFVEVFGQKTRFFEFEPGKYSVSLVIPFSAKEGENSFSVSAAKKDGSLIVAEATATGKIVVEKTTPIIETILPKDDFFQIGDIIEFEILAYYPDKSKVVDAKAFVLVNAKEIPLRQAEPGRFVGSYAFSEEDVGSPFVSIKVADSYGNVVSVEKKVSVIGESFSYVLARNALQLIAVLAIAAALFFFVFRGALARSFATSKKKNISLAEARIRELQENYFQKGLMSRAQYESEMQKLSEKLEKAKRR
ncbi:MAG: hypothetical protein PHD95_06460, partial [Candidatus ainarchaeum sp.]|nr:hypothetical protein [Candidatus ainarchaeum sp.]